jgi:membrane protein implicated in regulation of membrane protease activity
VLALIETFTLSIITIWFSIGAIFAMFVSLLGAQFWNQFTVFLLTSAVMLVFTRPVAKKYINQKVKKTNLDLIIGQTAEVLETINNAKEEGLVKVAGKEWSAKNIEEDEIAVGTLVEVIEIRGVRLFVKRKL